MNDLGLKFMVLVLDKTVNPLFLPLFLIRLILKLVNLCCFAALPHSVDEAKDLQ